MYCKVTIRNYLDNNKVKKQKYIIQNCTLFDSSYFKDKIIQNSCMYEILRKKYVKDSSFQKIRNTFVFIINL